MIDPSIKELTEMCEREDCRIQVGRTTSTLMGHGSGYYDKNGKYHPPVDMNSYYTELKCISCGKQWEEIRQMDKSRIRDTVEGTWI